MSISEQSKTIETTQEVVYLAYDRVSSRLITSELERVGFRIRITSSIGETIFCLREPRYAALIVGPLVQPNDKVLLASELRRRHSKTKIVFLHRDIGEKSSDILAGADAVLNVQNGAEAVIRALKRLLVSSRS